MRETHIARRRFVVDVETGERSDMTDMQIGRRYWLFEPSGNVCDDGKQLVCMSAPFDGTQTDADGAFGRGIQVEVDHGSAHTAPEQAARPEFDAWVASGDAEHWLKNARLTLGGIEVIGFGDDDLGGA